MRCARRGVRVRRPTRPAGLGFHSSEQPRSPGTGRRPGPSCTLQVEKALEFWRNRMRILLPSPGGAETEAGVTVDRGAPEAIRRADVHRLIVERPASKSTRDLINYIF